MKLLKTTLNLFLATCLSFFALNTNANPLEDMHKQSMELAKKDVLSATEPFKKAVAHQDLAAALDSLSRSDEAVIAIDEGLKLAPSNKDLLNTKAKIFFSLEKYEDALNNLRPRLEKTIEDSNTQGALGIAFLAGQKEGFITAMYSYTALGQYDAAADALSNFVDPFDPSSAKYRALWYTALVELGAKVNQKLERSLNSLPRAASHYDFIMEMMKGNMQPEDVLKRIQTSSLKSDSKQDALAEALFFIGIKEKKTLGAQKRLNELNQLAPYGSAEWKLARRIFK